MEQTTQSNPKADNQKAVYDAQMALYKLGLATKPIAREVPQQNSWGTPVAARQ